MLKIHFFGLSCRHSDNTHQNTFLPTFSQTSAHPPQPQFQCHCFGHSWPLCFTYQSLSAAVELPFFSPCFLNCRAKLPTSLFGGLDYTHSTSLIHRTPKISQIIHLYCLRTDARFTATQKQQFLTGFPVIVQVDNLKLYQHRLRGLHTSWKERYRNNNIAMFFGT